MNGFLTTVIRRKRSIVVPKASVASAGIYHEPGSGPSSSIKSSRSRLVLNCCPEPKLVRSLAHRNHWSLTTAADEIFDGSRDIGTLLFGEHSMLMPSVRIPSIEQWGFQETSPLSSLEELGVSGCVRL